MSSLCVQIYYGHHQRNGQRPTRHRGTPVPETNDDTKAPDRMSSVSHKRLTYSQPSGNGSGPKRRETDDPKNEGGRSSTPAPLFPTCPYDPPFSSHWNPFGRPEGNGEGGGRPPPSRSVRVRAVGTVCLTLTGLEAGSLGPATPHNGPWDRSGSHRCRFPDLNPSLSPSPSRGPNPSLTPP